MQIGSVTGLLKLRDEFSKQLDIASAKMEAAGKRAARTGQQFKDAGTKLSLGLTLPLVAVSAAAFRMSKDLSESMVRIETLVGLSRETVQGFRKDIDELARSTAKSPKELAEGLYFLTSAGLAAKTALEALRASAKASALGLGDTQSIANAVSSVMNAYASSGMTAARATNVLALAVRAGKLEADELAPVMGRIVPMAAALGVSFEDVAGSMAVMSRTGLNAAESAVSLNAFMSLLAKGGTKQAKETLSKLGLEMGDLRDIIKKPGGVIEAMRLLHERTKELDDEALAQVIPEIRALRGVLNVMAQDAGKVDQVMRDVAAGTDVLTDGTKQLHEEVGFKMKAAFNSLSVEVTKLGDAMAPFFMTVAKGVSGLSSAFGKMVDIFSSMPAAARLVVGALGGIAGASGPALLVVGQLLQSWASIATQAPRTAAAIKLVWSALILPAAAAAGLAELFALGLKRDIAQTNKEMASLLTDAQRAARAFEAMRAAQTQVVTTGFATLDANQWGALTSRIDELKTRISATLPEVDRLRARFEEFGTVSARESLEEAEGALKRDQNELRALESVIDKTKPAIELLAESVGGASTAVEKLSKEELANLRSALGDLTGRLDPMAGLMASWRAEQDLLKLGLDSGELSLRKYAKMTTALALEVAKAADEMRKSPFADPSFGRTLVIPGLKGGSFANVPIPSASELTLAAAAMDRLVTPTQRYAKALEEIDKEGLKGELRTQAVIDAAARYREEMDKLGDSMKKVAVDPLGEALKEIAKNFRENMQRAFADTIYQFIRTGEFSFKDLWETFKDLGARAIAELVVKWAATKFVIGGSGSGDDVSGNGVIAGLAKLAWAKYGASIKAWATSSAGTAVIASAAAVALVAVYRKSVADARNRLVFGTTASTSFGDGGLVGRWAGKLNQTGPKIAEDLTKLIKAITDAAGSALIGMKFATIKIRNDKSVFEAIVGGESLGIFLTASEAMIAAARKAFLSADFAGPVNEWVRRVITNFQGLVKSPEQMAEAVDLVAQLSREISNLSDTDYAIQTLRSSLIALESQLISLGVSVADASELVMQVGIKRFTKGFNSLYGIEQSPKEQLEAKRASFELLAAELELYKLELKAKADKLAADIKFAEAHAKIGQRELEIEGWRLKGRAAVAQVTIDLWKAELAAINAALTALGKINVDISKVKLGGSGFGKNVDKFGSAVNDLKQRFRDLVEDFRRTILETRTTSSATALPERDALGEMFKQFRDNAIAGAAGNLDALALARDLYRPLSEAAKAYSGGGGGLGFLGFGGDSFSEFFAWLNSFATDIISGETPKKITEKGVVFDERMYKAAEHGARETSRLASTNESQNKTLINQQGNIVTLESAILAELKRANRTQLAMAG